MGDATRINSSKEHTTIRIYRFAGGLNWVKILEENVNDVDYLKLSGGYYKYGVPKQTCKEML